MSNQLLTIAMITRESLRILENNLTFTKSVNREYDDQFARSGAKIGTTLNLRLPSRYVGRSGPTLSVENQTENFFPLVLNTQFGVDVQFTSQEMELSLDDFSERVLAPAIAAVSNKIDFDGLNLIPSTISNAVGVPGAANNALTNYLSASALLKKLGGPQDNMRSAILDPSSEASLVGALTTLFNPSREIADQYKDGKMGNAIGFKWSCDQNVQSYTVGPLGGTPTVNGIGAHPNGSDGQISTSGWTAAAAARLKIGDIFTMAGVNSVNPQTRKSTGSLQQFVVTAAFSSSATGTGDISISPTLVASGQFQNVDAFPANGAALTILGAANTVSPCSILFHRDAFVLGSADLPLPRGVHMAERVHSKKVGLSIRMIQAYDVVNDIFPCRLDVLYGWAVPYPQLACRVQS